MDYDRLILIDYENVQFINITDIIDEKTKMIIVIRENQKELPIDLIQETQPFGNSIEWLQIENDIEKSVLNYYFTVYLLGNFISNPSNKEFIVFSNDNSYDSLIEYLKNKNIHVERMVNLKQINTTYKKDFIKNCLGIFLMLWGKLTSIQKICFVAIAVAIIGGIIALLTVSTVPAMVPVIDYPIADLVERERIVARINQENVRTSVNTAGVVHVIDEPTARRMRVILIREDLIPNGAAPWNIFDKDRWTLTDIERNINFQRAQRQMITDHIKALDDVDNAVVDIVFPKRELFATEQNPTTASVMIIPKPGSDIITSPQNRKKIEGIQKMLQYAIEGLKAENIVITDPNGVILNDFEHGTE